MEDVGEEDSILWDGGTAGESFVCLLNERLSLLPAAPEERRFSQSQVGRSYHWDVS
jgi:hypothetical protein